MRLKKLELKYVLGVLMSVLIILTMTLTVKASNDNYSFSFSLKPHYANAYSGDRYRQTTNVNNKWKVNLQKSAEGSNSKATFWLSQANHKQASGTHQVQCGSGAHYYVAWSNASSRDVCLSAENNNDSANSYKISGKWDEETN